MLNRLFFFPLLGIALAAGFASSGTAATKPNIILILADDLGASELGCYGNTRASHAQPGSDGRRGLAAGHVLRHAAVYADARLPDDRTIRLSQRLPRHGERSLQAGAGFSPAGNRQPCHPRRPDQECRLRDGPGGQVAADRRASHADPRLRIRRVPDVGLQAQSARGRGASRAAGRTGTANRRPPATGTRRSSRMENTCRRRRTITAPT